MILVILSEIYLEEVADRGIKAAVMRNVGKDVKLGGNNAARHHGKEGDVIDEDKVHNITGAELHSANTLRTNHNNHSLVCHNCAITEVRLREEGEELNDVILIY